MRTDTQTIIAAMRHLAATVQSDDGVANAAIAEAADRLRELHDACESEPIDACVASFCKAEDRMQTLRQIIDAIEPHEARTVRDWITERLH
jgi:hypothetical protein